MLGRVAQITVKVGDWVREGDLLIVLDSAELEAATAQAKAAVAAAQAQPAKVRAGTRPEEIAMAKAALEMILFKEVFRRLKINEDDRPVALDLLFGGYRRWLYHCYRHLGLNRLPKGFQADAINEAP